MTAVLVLLFFLVCFAAEAAAGARHAAKHRPGSVLRGRNGSR